MQSTTIRSLCAATLALASAVPAAAQNPTSTLLQAAAQQLNQIAPQAVQHQTLPLGTFDGANGEMLWVIPVEYPPGTPEFKKLENGGPVHPRAKAPIRSYDLTYQIDLQNKPANLSIELHRFLGDGTTELIAPAVISGNTARIDFHPQTTSKQLLRFNSSAGAEAFSIWPQFQPEIGGFVVPHLLIAIVYEPPGGRSIASYAQSSSSGTVVTFGFASSSGLVQTEDPSALMQLAYDGMAAVAGSFCGPMGKAVEVLTGLQENVSIQTTTTSTTASENSLGTQFTVSAQFSTGLHQFPGAGDRFIVLSDVLFVYLAQGGKVHLAPMAYGQVRGMTAAEMQAALPPADYQRFVALDPLISGGMPQLGQQAFPTWFALAALDSPKLRQKFASPRFVHFATWPCEQSGANQLEIRKSDMQSTGITKTTTQTTLYQVSGLAAMLEGDGDEQYGYSYSSSNVQYAEDEVAASISLWCGPDEAPFACEVWYDKLFRTFLCTRGDQLMAQAQAIVDGNLTDEQGLARPGERVTLALGGRRWMTRTDARGDFRFPFVDLPRGQGALMVGRQAWAIDTASAPVKGVRLGLARDGGKLASPIARSGVEPPIGSRPSLDLPKGPVGKQKN